MQQLLYHGSQFEIRKPTYGLGKPYNDYGLGFYCTDQPDMAKEWAVSLDRDGFANAYRLEMDGLTVLNLNREPYGILHWLAVLLENRQFDMPSPLAQEARDYLLRVFAVNYNCYDLMIGYRADDSNFSFAQDFINGTISYRQLGNAMQLGKLGQQIVLKSERAFAQIEFLSAEVVKCDEWYAKKTLRDKSARKEYFNTERNRRQRGDLYITTILDEEMKPDDPRLR